MLIFELDHGNSSINIWYKFNENPSKFVGMRALTKKCDGRTHGHTDARTHGWVDARHFYVPAPRCGGGQKNLMLITCVFSHL